MARNAKHGSQPRGTPMSDIHKALSVLPPAARAAAIEALRGKPKPTKITRRELLTMWDRLETLMDVNTGNAMFAHRVAANRQAMKSTITEIERAAEPPEDYKAFDKEREDLCKEFAEKDDKGALVQEGDRYKIPDEKREEFERRAEEIRQKHAKAIDVYTAMLDVREKMLDEEVTCPTFVPIPAPLLPGGLTPRFLEPLLIMLQ